MVNKIHKIYVAIEIFDVQIGENFLIFVLLILSKTLSSWKVSCMIVFYQSLIWM